MSETFNWDAVRVKHVKEAVCAVYDMKWESIVAESTSYLETEARHCFMYVCVKKLGLKLQFVSSLVGRKGHSNTCQHVNLIQFYMDNEKYLVNGNRVSQRNTRVLKVLDHIKNVIYA